MLRLFELHGFFHVISLTVINYGLHVMCDRGLFLFLVCVVLLKYLSK